MSEDIPNRQNSQNNIDININNQPGIQNLANFNNILENPGKKVVQNTNDQFTSKANLANRDHPGNQSTDCDDIVPQFKNVQPQSTSNFGQSLVIDTQNETTIQSQNDNKLSNGQLQKDSNQSQKFEEENKNQQVKEQIKYTSKSSSSCLSSTSSEDQTKQTGKNSQSSSQSSDSMQSKIKDNLKDLHKVQIQNKTEIDQHHMPQTIQETVSQIQIAKKTSSPLNDDSQIQKIQEVDVMSQRLQQEERKPEILEVNEPQTQSLEQSDEEDEADDDDDDDEPNESQGSFVVEESPKGRFKRFGEELGRGAYKIVYKGIDNETGREIAWNVINLKRLPKQDRVRIKFEIYLIKILEHKNIIHFISAWVNKQKEQVVFITEMITGGSLRKYVKKIKHPRLRVIKGWCSEILQGLVYLHEQTPHPIIHRDLKCDNIFINSNSGEIRIGDLGLSTPMQNSFTTSVLGTPEFMAPELYEECYGTSVDIYAFGMCVLEMITLERPYKECQNPAQIYNKVVQGIRPQALERIEDEEVKDFILQCLTTADKRPSAKELLESKFLKEIESDKNNREVKVKPATKSKGLKRKKSLQYMKKHGSTILEEEEENSEDDGERKKQDQLQEQERIEGIQKQQQEAKNLNDAQNLLSQVQLKVPELVNDKQVSPNITVDNQSQLNTNEDIKIIQASDQEKLENQQDLLQSHLSLSVEQSTEKKKRKSGSKKKKLNESVIFLKKIDKEKQKKMQEITMRQQQREDNNDDEDQTQYKNDDSDKDDVKIQENMLSELLQQDRELEKLQFEQQQQQELLQKVQIKQTTEINYQENLQKPAQQQQYDSGDQNVRTPLNNNATSQNRGSMGNFAQAVDSKKEKKMSNLIKIGKNYKEDASTNVLQKSVTTTTQNQKPILQQKVQQVTDQKVQQITEQKVQNQIPTNAVNDDVKKSISKELQNQQPQNQDIITNRSSTIQDQNQQDIRQKNIPHQQYHHQNSDLHLSSQSSTTQNLKQNQPKRLPHVGSHILENNQPQENVFDVQSSSEENSDKNHDSEVDNIQLPKNQIDEVIQNPRNYPGTPYNDTVQVHFNRSSNEGTQTSQLKKANTNKQIDNKQISASQQNFTLSQNSVNQLVKPQIQSTQSQSKIPEQDKAKPKPTQDLKQTQSADVKRKELQPNSQQQPQTKTSTGQTTATQNPQKLGQPQTTPNPQSSQQQNPQPLVYLHSAAKLDDKPYSFDITFKVRSFDGTQDKEVFFEFDNRQDTAQGVADEMVRELKLPQSQILVIENLIKSIVQKKDPVPHQPQQVDQKQVPITKPQIETPQQIPPQVNIQQVKKESPQKLSKDQANAYFTKIFDSVDQSFQYLQNKNIYSINEIIEVIEGSPEEIALKSDFLNQVLSAKKQYKRGLDDYKKKVDLKKKQVNNGQLSDVQNKTKVSNEKQLPVKPPTNQTQQQQQQAVQKKPTQNDSDMKRVNSTQDMSNYISSHDEERKQQQAQTSKITFLIPQYVKKQFKVAPAQINIPQKLQSNLKRVYNETIVDEEVMSLQNILNLIFEVSVLQMMQSKDMTSESQTIIQNYIPLRVDGFYGEKTEALVIKFQKHSKVYEDGIVSDSLWTSLLSYVDYIIKEEQKKQAQIQQQAQQLSQQQPQNLVKEIKPPQVQQQTINTAAQVQIFTFNQPPKIQKSSNTQVIPQSQSLKSIYQQPQNMSNQNQQSRLSPTKYLNKKSVQDVDYQTTLEQAFVGANINRYYDDQQQDQQDQDYDDDK